PGTWHWTVSRNAPYEQNPISTAQDTSEPFHQLCKLGVHDHEEMKEKMLCAKKPEFSSYKSYNWHINHVVLLNSSAQLHIHSTIQNVD
ncbi:mCG145878, partial [Mus musculus]